MDSKYHIYITLVTFFSMIMAISMVEPVFFVNSRLATVMLLLSCLALIVIVVRATIINLNKPGLKASEHPSTGTTWAYQKMRQITKKKNMLGKLRDTPAISSYNNDDLKSLVVLTIKDYVKPNLLILRPVFYNVGLYLFLLALLSAVLMCVIVLSPDTVTHFNGLTKSDNFLKFFYFSFVASTTIGFGDISVFNAQKTSCGSLFGEIYVVILGLLSITYIVIFLNLLMAYKNEINEDIDIMAEKTTTTLAYLE